MSPSTGLVGSMLSIVTAPATGVHPATVLSYKSATRLSLNHSVPSTVSPTGAVELASYTRVDQLPDV